MHIPQAITDESPDRPQAPTWTEYQEYLGPQWGDLLNSNPNEREMQEFLELHPCFLPGAIDGIGKGGHHGPAFSAVIRQPPLQGLGPTRVPDFMWVRRDTGAIRPICIEIESPSKSWFNKGSRTPTAELTQAIDQLTEWKVWFSSPENRLIFGKTYAPNYADRPIDPQFVLIFGRNSEFRPGSSKHDDPQYMRLKRDHMARASEHFFTYDQLKPERGGADYATATKNVTGWALHSVPPTFSTGAHIMDLTGAVSDPSKAVHRAGLIGPERQAYLLDRWRYWRSVTLSPQSHMYSLGRE
ncbi:Shedu anti-phage system protein SduA domain-containing protein [Streptomyces sp. NPDC057250]|uniref:Shedu anti-phage system protein SduA domain-containing protein n=2 Tax=Streptomyces TaxID=1883 RepID=UPI003627B527